MGVYTCSIMSNQTVKLMYVYTTWPSGSKISWHSLYFRLCISLATLFKQDSWHMIIWSPAACHTQMLCSYKSSCFETIAASYMQGGKFNDSITMCSFFLPPAFVYLQEACSCSLSYITISKRWSFDSQEQLSLSKLEFRDKAYHNSIECLSSICQILGIRRLDTQEGLWTFFLYSL